jgi:hypothetical protein
LIFCSKAATTVAAFGVPKLFKTSRTICAHFSAHTVPRVYYQLPVEVSFIATSLDDPSQEVQTHIF